jgi:histidinol-phosphate/aromatic aminotransferase/cobyric acid decarboxylase-like protein
MFAQLAAGLEGALKRQPGDAAAVTAQLARALRLNPATVVVANGSTELVTWLDQLWVTESVAVPVPTASRWIDRPMDSGKRVDLFPLREQDAFELDVDRYLAFIRARGSRAAVLRNPNDPDGGYVPRREVLRFLDELADLDLVVVDETSIEVVDTEHNPSVAAEAALRPNVAVVASPGTSLGLPGARFGYLVANPALAATVRRALPRWNVNGLAEALLGLLAQHRPAYRESLRLVARDRFAMGVELARIPELGVYSSQADVLLVRLADDVDGAELREHLWSRHGVLVHDCADQLGLSSQFLRLVVRPAPDVARLTEGIRTFLLARRPRRERRDPASAQLSAIPRPRPRPDLRPSSR